MTMLVAALVLAVSPWGPAAAVGRHAAPAPAEADPEPGVDDPASDSTTTPEDDEPEPPLAEAGDAFRRGVQAFKEERYEDAVRHFTRAQRLAPHADSLYNLGLAQQLAGNHVGAWQTFETLLEETTDPDERDDVLAAQANSRPHVVVLRVLARPGSTICLDEYDMLGDSGARMELTTPGEHRLDVDGETRTLQLVGGETRRIDMVLPPPTSPPIKPPRRALRVLSGFSIAGAAGAGGLGLGAALVEEPSVRLGLGLGSAGLGTMALTSTIAALVVRRRARVRSQKTEPPRYRCRLPRPDR
ncbi:MAG: tetratricopeptide repeat protein [Myxococcota bacterium]